MKVSVRGNTPILTTTVPELDETTSARTCYEE